MAEVQGNTYIHILTHIHKFVHTYIHLYTHIQSFDSPYIEEGGESGHMEGELCVAPVQHVLRHHSHQ